MEMLQFDFRFAWITAPRLRKNVNISTVSRKMCTFAKKILE